MPSIVWTKEWSAADDGTVFDGRDLKNLQDDISAGVETNATSIQGVSVEVPTAADDDKVMYYDHLNLKFDYLELSTAIPTGIITLWSGSIANIPSGWALCDGSSGTPNLTDRFVIHADADAAGTNNVGDTGGASTHTLTVAEMPAHTHPVDIKGNGITPGTIISGSDNVGDPGVNPPTESTGGGGAHNNRDRYYALAYIMKT